MDTNDVLKAISNPIRMAIVQWLKNPHEHFTLDGQIEPAEEVGVCVSIIQENPDCHNLLFRRTCRSYNVRVWSAHCGLVSGHTTNEKIKTFRAF